MQGDVTSHSTLDKALAFAVHIFTASGAVCALMAIIAISRHQFSECMLWLLLAFIIDGVDGMFARKFKVREVLPQVQGKNIDFVIDFANYIIVPAYFLFEAFWMVDGQVQLVLPASEGIRIFACSMMLISSAIYYGKEPMISEDMYFIGFPAVWNAVAYYMFFVFNLSPWVNFGFIVLFSILHFVPIKYAYPSRGGYLKYLMLVIAVIALSSMGLLLYVFPERPWYYVWGAISGIAFLAYHTTYINWNRD